MTCELCGQQTEKLYDCIFKDEPEDFGYILKVCLECIPKEMEDYFDEGNIL